TSSTIRSRCSAPSAACSDRTFRSKSCGRPIASWWTPIAEPPHHYAPNSAMRFLAAPLRASIASNHNRLSWEEVMALEIKILDYGDIELESSFLVLGRDCGRTRRVLTLGFLILGGQYPIVVDTGYRSNQ